MDYPPNFYRQPTNSFDILTIQNIVARNLLFIHNGMKHLSFVDKIPNKYWLKQIKKNVDPDIYGLWTDMEKEFLVTLFIKLTVILVKGFQNL